MGMKYYNYTKIGTPTVATDFPAEPNTLWEIDQSAGRLLAIIDPDGDEIQSSDDKGLTWTVEVSGTNGALLAVSSWHDRANKLLYTIETDAANDAETYVVDYSTWSNITITKHNGDLGTVLSNYHEADIFLRDGNLEAVVCNNAQIDARRYGDPWVSIDTNADNVQFISSVVVVGTIAYFYGDIPGADTVGMYSFDGATVDTLDTIAATSYSALTAGRNLAYDGDNLIYFIAIDDGTGDRYLYSYNITGDAITKHGVSTFVLMRDRDTAIGVKEKGWDWSVNNFDVYQLHDVIKFQLHKIAIPPITAGYKIHTVTDNFLWAIKTNGAVTSEIWELEDKIKKLITVDIVHEIMEPPGGDITLKRDVIPLENNMVMKFYDTYTASIMLYKGTYNFGDDVNGIYTVDADAEDNITFIDTANIGVGCSIGIIESLDGHKKVLELHDNSNTTQCDLYNTFSSSQTSGTIEFWIRMTDVTQEAQFVVYSGGALAMTLRIRTDKWQEFSGGGWHDIAGGGVSDNTWYHIKWDFDCGTDTYDFYLDEVLIDAANPFRTAVANITQLRILTNNVLTGYYVYFDAFGYSWDTNYTEGDNLIGVDQIIFEGVIYKHTETDNQTVNLESLAEIDLDTKPSGDYAGDSDEIITSLITDYCNYITKGTFSSGTAMGTITFGGDKTLGTILDELAYFENWIWYLTPTGVLYYNNGTVDSLVNLSEADNVHFVIPTRPKEIYNRIKIKGAYVDGVQVESEWKENLESQQTIGVKTRTFTFGFLNTTALCNIAAINILTRLGKEPLSVNFTHQDESIGFMQPGETITFEFNRGGIIVSSDQFLITEVIYIDQSVGIYTIRDELP